MDQTPSVVKIHEVDEGIDSGPIIYEKYLQFDKNEFKKQQLTTMGF